MSSKKGWEQEFHLKTVIVLRLAEMQSFHIDLFAADLVHDIAIIVDDLMKCDEHDNFNQYFGKVKLVITQFLEYWHRIADEIKCYDDDVTLATQDNLFLILRQSRVNHFERHERFKREVRHFMPVLTTDMYHLMLKMDKESEAMEKHFDELVTRIFWAISDKDLIALFEELLAGCKAWVQNVFDNGADCLSVALQEQIPQLKDNFSVILRNTLHNIDVLEKENQGKVRFIQGSLYEKNKKKFQLLKSCSKIDPNEMAELEFMIKKLQKDLTKQLHYKCFGLLELYKKRDYYANLKEQVEFTASKLVDLQEKWVFVEELTTETHKDFRFKMRDIGADELFTDFEKLHMLDLLEDKWQGFVVEGENVKKNLRESHQLTRKILLTTLCVEGEDHVMHSGVMGMFYVNEYGRKIYKNAYSIEEFVSNCDGTLRKLTYPKHEYSYDTSGRYYIDNDCHRIYKRSECSSEYRLAPDGFLVKIAQDCGHSNSGNIFCGQNLIPQPAVQVPLLDDRFTKGCLSEEDFTYIWDNLGTTITKAAIEVAKMKPLNPVYWLGRKILGNKYNMPGKFKEDLQSSVQHREDAKRKREEARENALKEWLATQMKSGDGTDCELIKQRKLFESTSEQNAYEQQMSSQNNY